MKLVLLLLLAPGIPPFLVPKAPAEPTPVQSEVPVERTEAELTASGNLTTLPRYVRLPATQWGPSWADYSWLIAYKGEYKLYVQDQEADGSNNNNGSAVTPVDPGRPADGVQPQLAEPNDLLPEPLRQDKAP